MMFPFKLQLNRLCKQGRGDQYYPTPSAEDGAHGLLHTKQGLPLCCIPNLAGASLTKCISCDEWFGFSINLRIPSHLHTFLQNDFPHF